MLEVGTRGHYFCLLTAFILISVFPSFGRAAIQCYECHGTKNPVDFRPIDSPYRNITTGGFQGNHRTHITITNPLVQCEFCHSGSSSYNQGHRSGNIDISRNINNSRVRALYRNLTSPWPQTSTPVYGTCTNVNCHFEKETPEWGSLPFTVLGNCGSCHGFPPAGADTGAEGSHFAPGHLMGGNIDSCRHCHPGHAGFTHATSVRRNLLVTPADPTFSPAGTYDGPVNDYLPSQNNLFGQCNNTYCHSNGTSVVTGAIIDNSSPAWGGGIANCASCHGYPPGFPNGSPKANSHVRHAEYGFTCNRCHYGTTSDNTSIKNWKKHISKFYNISSQQERLLYSFAADGGTCTNGYCHSNGTSKSTGVVSANTAKWGNSSLQCTTCHANPPAYVNGTPKTNSHELHATYGYGCNKCHVATTSDGTTITGLGMHANGNYDVVAGNGASFSYVYASSGGTCTSNACHSDGTSIATGIPSSQPADWGASLGCSGCHGLPPEYANGSKKVNSHIGKHSAYLCNICHYPTSSDGVSVTNLSNHLNGQYNVASAIGLFAYTYAAGGGTCSNVQCHANPSGSRAWGAKDCDACHGAPPNTPAHLKHFSGSALQASYTSVKSAEDYAASSSGYIFNCGNCHPIDINKHGNNILEVELYNANAPQGSIKSLQPTASYTKGNRYYLDSRGFAYTNGTCGNVYCHSYSDWTTPGVENCMSNYSTCETAAVASLVQTRVYKTVKWNDSLPVNCTGCHANGPRTTSATNFGSTGNNHSWINDQFFEEGHFGKYYFKTDPISCTFCHNGTVSQLNNWSRAVNATPSASNPRFTAMSSVPIANFSNHVNGKVDVQFDRERTYTINFPGTYGRPPLTTFYRMSTSTYSTETKTCSNVSCHLGQTSVKWGTPYRAYRYSWGEDHGCVKCHDANHPYY